jgi:hypothetical protein
MGMVVTGRVMVLPRFILTDTSHMVVMTVLGLTNCCLKPRQLDTILAELTIHIGAAVHSFLRAFLKDLNEQRMRIKVPRTEDLYLGMLGRKLGRQTPDTLLQDARKEKKWKYHNPGKSHTGATH